MWGELLHANLFSWYLQALSSPSLFLPLLIQVMPLQALQDFLGETGALWALSFPCQGAEQSRLSCEPAPLRVVLSTLLPR